MNFGERLYHARMMQGLTQAGLAERIPAIHVARRNQSF